MSRAILNLRGMTEGKVRETKSKKLLNMHRIYNIELPGLPLNYVLPWWKINDLDQIEKDTHIVAADAKKQGTSVMVRSAHYREKYGKALPEVSMPYSVNRITHKEIYNAVLDVLQESKKMVEGSSIDIYKPNIVLCTSVDCYKSGMIHVHKNVVEIHSSYGNVVALLRHNFFHDTILIDHSFNVLDKITRKKGRMMNIRSGEFVVEAVPLDKQDSISVSDFELPLFINHIKVMVKSFPNNEIEAMWLQERDSEIYYSYLDLMEPSHRQVEEVVLDKTPVTYFEGVRLSELKGKIVYIPSHVLDNKEKADNAITFIACSEPKAVLLPKQVSHCSHRMKILREMGVRCETVE